MLRGFAIMMGLLWGVGITMMIYCYDGGNPNHHFSMLSSFSIGNRMPDLMRNASRPADSPRNML
jgi:hypothetical protein